MSEKYNGWTNYATWRINLEIFDGFNPREYFSDANGDIWEDELADNLKAYAEEIIESTSVPGLARDYAMAFLDNVDWEEIAKHMLDEYADA